MPRLLIKHKNKFYVSYRGFFIFRKIFLKYNIFKDKFLFVSCNVKLLKRVFYKRYLLFLNIYLYNNFLTLYLKDKRT